MRALALGACLLSAAWAKAQPAAHEYAVKAALLFNFSQFVDWPPEALAGGTNAPFVIGILGSDPFGGFLDKLVEHERAHGKPIEVRRFYRVEQTFDSHIVFVCKSEQGKIESVLSRLRARPILTVTDGELDGGGGMIALDREGGRIKLHINLEATRSAGLTISAKLLRVADTVRAAP